MKRLWLLLALPCFQNDPEKTRQGQLLHVVALILFGVILILLLTLNLVIDKNYGAVFNVVLTSLALLQLLALYLIRRGQVRMAGFLLLTVSWLGITWLASVYGGVRSVILFAYFTITLGAGYVFGWRMVTLFTAVSILAIWLLALYETWGLSRPVRDDPIIIALILTALFVFSSVQIYFIITVLKKSLRETDLELRERLHVEQQLRLEQERLALALDAAKMGTWNWDIETGAVAWSDKIEALFGMARGEFDRKYETYLALIHPEDLPGLQQLIERALADANYHYVVEHRLLWKNGETRWLEGRGNVYRDAAGRPIRMAGTVVDITDRKKAEAEREHLMSELAEKNTELEQFTYTVSHDLKAPIITIKGFLGYLEQDAISGNQARVQRDMARINDAVDRMYRLLNELLELSRIGRKMDPPEPVAFTALVYEALELVQGRLQAGVPQQIKIAEGMPVVYGDRKRLLEVLQNLLDNALKFSGKQPTPQIEVGVHGFETNAAIFFVRDNGVGVAPLHHERIFGLFNKLDPQAEGTGVGLAIVKRIIEFHGGRIWLESEVGQGTTFFFTLPLAEK